MSTEKPQTGPWGRKLWVVVATLTAIGLVGPVIFLPKVIPLANYCDPYVFYDFLVLIGVALVVLAGVAGLGLLMFWLRSRWGALVLVFCNLLMMGFYGLAGPIYPGELVWAAVLLVIGAAPVIAAALALWALLTRGRLWVRAVEAVIIAVIALPPVWLYGFGMTNDIRTALTPPPPVHALPVSQGQVGGCAVRPGSI
jgi:hypothetical protein